MGHGRYVYVHTFGCQMNTYDAERMVESLAPHGYEATEDPERADVILLNTCSVRLKAEDKAWSALGRYVTLRERNPDLVVGLGGCMANRGKESLFKQGLRIDVVFGTDNIPELGGLVARAQARRGRRVHSTAFVPRSRYRFPTARVPADGRVTTMVTVMKGCNKFCSFCIVPHTRGREVSKPPGEVVAEVQRAVAAGVREVTLLGQNVNSYGRDFDLKEAPPPGVAAGQAYRFADLLAAVDGVEGLERIRFTTSHPWDATEALAAAFRDLPKLCPYLHLPLQSGSDRVLQMMRRGHTFDTYRGLIDRLRRYRPDIALSTDIIVGFPGEREEDFEATLRALDAIRYDSLFVFKYSVRPGTAAARLVDDVPAAVKQRRLEAVLEAQGAHGEAALARYVGGTQPVLVERVGLAPSVRGGGLQLSGRTPHNVIVNVALPSGAPPGAQPGAVLPVFVESARAHSLAGRLA